MTSTLVVLASGRVMGRVVQEGGRLRFSYDSDWSGMDAFPLSLSMPIAGRNYGDKLIAPFLANLLPDNENTVGAWAKELQTSTNPFALLRYKGKDCPGASQFVPEELVDEVLSGKSDSFESVTDPQIAERLREVRLAARSGRRTSNSGQFSLAGAQPKISLALRNGQWAIPIGRHPTTHILKPSVDDDGIEINEHCCLELARAIGLTAAASEIVNFEDELTIVVARYDRDTSSDRFQRIHQEDCCQARGVHPRQKYQNEGGPSAQQIAQLITESSSRPAEDSFRFVEALLFNYLIVGTDAHAKNYSLLLPSARDVRLSPLYDVASALPHLDLSSRAIKFAMKIGDHYSVRDVSLHDWEKEARLLGVSNERLTARMRTMMAQIPDCIQDVESECRKAGLRHPILQSLSTELRARVQRLQKEYGFT